MPQPPSQPQSSSYMGDPSQMMAGLAPAFMNQPQHQKQMQNLAMQVRQQEEGTKKIKKYLKAYEDIQLSGPISYMGDPSQMQPGQQQMQQPQAPQQPGFMQPPGGGVKSMNNTIPRNEPEIEDAPTSFTEMAGGQIPEEGMMSTSEDTEEMSTPTSDTGGTEPYGPNRDAQGKPYTSPTMTNTGGLSMNTNWTPEEKAQMESDKAASAEYRKSMGLDKQDRRNAVEGRDKRQDKVPLEQRGDKEAMDPDRQHQRKRSDNTSRWMGQSSATLKEHDKRDGLRDALKGLKETIQKVTDGVDKTFRPNTYHYDGKTWVINEQGPDWDSKSGKAAKAEITKINTSVKKLEQQVEGSKKKQNKISSSKPNKALGLAGLTTGLIGGAASSSAGAFPPEDAEIFFGRMNADKDFNRLNAREKAAVQKFLEYKAESDSIDARVDVPKGRSGQRDKEPIEYTSAQKAMRSQ